LQLLLSNNYAEAEGLDKEFFSSGKKKNGGFVGELDFTVGKISLKPLSQCI